MKRLLGISLVLLILSQSSALADVLVIIRQQAEAAGNYVRICDIARVEGPKEIAAEVGKTVIGPTPPRGEVKEITRWEIEHRLYETGLNAEVIFSGNNSVKVTGNGSAGMQQYDFEPYASDLVEEKTDFPAAEVKPNTSEKLQDRASASERAEIHNDVVPQAEKPAPVAGADRQAPRNPLAVMREEAKQRVIDAVSSYLASRYRRPDVEVETKLIAISDVIPVEAAEITVQEALEGRLPGKAKLALRVLDGRGEKVSVVAVAIDADVYALAPVAAKPLYKGDVLTPKDVLVTRIKMRSGFSYLPPDARAVEGREIQKPVSPGAPILATDATPTDAVKRGSVVTVDASGKGWRLQASAKALASGNVGEVISVEDTSTKTKYQARVVGYGKVAALPGTRNKNANT